MTAHQQSVFEDRYQQYVGETMDQMFRRVAKASARDEITVGRDRRTQEDICYSNMSEMLFMPAGRPLCNLGPDGNNMAFNCFVIPIEDSRKSITKALADFTEIASMGGGIGSSYSKLRPAGDPTKKSKGVASGPCSFIDVFQTMGATIKQQGSRGLASMVVLQIDHPDIEMFIRAKHDNGRWPTANISVAITNKFMEAVQNNTSFDLVWNDEVRKTVDAQYLWDLICTQAHRNGDPGLLFIDTINQLSPFWGIETIEAANPCGEQPLPANLACDLGSINVLKFVNWADKTIDLKAINKASYDLAITLDGFIDVSTYPAKKIENAVKKYRPIGVGMMGLADALFVMGIAYGNNPKALQITEEITLAIKAGALKASEDLAKDFGAFPGYKPKKMDFPPRRNITLTSYAPTGSVSAFCNVNGGIEPFFARTIKRTEELGVSITDTDVIDEYMNYWGLDELPNHTRFSLSTSPDTELTTMDHLAMLNVIANNCDTGVSKTINMPRDATIEDVSTAFIYCWENNIKGCTVFRTGSRDDAPMQDAEDQGICEDMDDFDEDDIVEYIEASLLPKKRPPSLPGRTYPIKPDPNGSTIWITINDFENAPFEIFLTTNNSIIQEYLSGLSRTITALLKLGVDINFLIDDFCKYESPNSGTYYEYEPGKHKRLKSTLDSIGTIMRKHQRIHTDLVLDVDNDKEEILEDVLNDKPRTEPQSTKCPQCGEYAYNVALRCPVCEMCGFSQCG